MYLYLLLNVKTLSVVCVYCAFHLGLQRCPLAYILLGSNHGGTHLDATHRRPVQMMYHLVYLAAIEVDFALRFLVLHEVDPVCGERGERERAESAVSERGKHACAFK